jgi:putative transposase
MYTRNTEDIRKRLQKKGRYSAIKKIKNRESHITKDVNHTISRKLVDIAQQTGLRLELLTGIRKNTTKKKYRKSLNY